MKLGYDRLCFMRKIAENLDDVAPRLAFADWLVEQGDEDDRQYAEAVIFFTENLWSPPWTLSLPEDEHDDAKAKPQPDFVYAKKYWEMKGVLEDFCRTLVKETGHRLGTSYSTQYGMIHHLRGLNYDSWTRLGPKLVQCCPLKMVRLVEDSVQITGTSISKRFRVWFVSEENEYGHSDYWPTIPMKFLVPSVREKYAEMWYDDPVDLAEQKKNPSAPITSHYVVFNDAKTATEFISESLIEWAVREVSNCGPKFNL